MVFQDTEYGALVSSAPRLEPSSRNWIPAMPTLSEALAVTVTVFETVEPGEGDVMVTVGGDVSFETVTVTAPEEVTLPAASRARPVSVWAPLLALMVFQDTEYGALVSSAPRLEPSRRNWTPAMPTLSEALAVTVTVFDTVAPDEGDVIKTVGEVISLNTVTVTGSEVHRTPSRSRATAVRTCEPLAVVIVFQATA